MSRKRTAILISGRGSNMASLIEAAMDPAYPAEISLVVSSRPAAPGLQIAAKAGLNTVGLDHKAYATRDAFDAEIQSHLEANGIELVCLAGFMRLMTAEFINAWRDRIINIHPSLLPAYKGLDTHERVLRDGGRVSGCTVHYVRPEMDEGPIIAQAAVGVRADDTPETLAARVLAAEHRVYPMALKLVAGDSIRVTGDKARFHGNETDAPALISPALEGD
ncbi:MAG: phosphoribosylglycinamide formyltransferase [Pseudomonadota bacterium]